MTPILTTDAAPVVNAAVSTNVDDIIDDVGVIIITPVIITTMHTQNTKKRHRFPY